MIIDREEAGGRREVGGRVIAGMVVEAVGEGLMMRGLLRGRSFIRIRGVGEGVGGIEQILDLRRWWWLLLRGGGLAARGDSGKVVALHCCIVALLHCCIVALFNYKTL